MEGDRLFIFIIKHFNPAVGYEIVFTDNHLYGRVDWACDIGEPEIRSQAELKQWKSFKNSLRVISDLAPIESAKGTDIDEIERSSKKNFLILT